jgi:proline iminopeptidase
MPLTRIGAHDLFVDTIGHGGLLITVHGGPGLDHSAFRPVLDPLSKRAKVVFYDQLGSGRSERVATLNGLGDWVDEIDAIRAHFGAKRCVVLGHSFGSFVALLHALKYPDTVAGLVLVGSAPRMDFTAQSIALANQWYPPAMVQAWIAAVSAPTVDDAAFAKTWREILPMYVHRADAAALDAMASRTVYSAMALNYGFAQLPTYDVTPRLGDVRAKTLVVTGKYDWVTPIEYGAKRLMAGLKSADFVQFDESGHYPFVEESAKFVDVVGKWLDALE